MRDLLIACLAGLALAGCQTQTPPEPDMSKMSPCEMVAYAIGDPRTSARNYMLAMELGRNKGCFGQAPAHRIELDHTVRVVQ